MVNITEVTGYITILAKKKKEDAIKFIYLVKFGSYVILYNAKTQNYMIDYYY